VTEIVVNEICLKLEKSCVVTEIVINEICLKLEL